MDLTMLNLQIAVGGAIEKRAKYFAIKVLLATGDFEVIINKTDVVEDSKLNYWENAYNDNLELKANTDIKIIGFTFGNDFNSIESDLLG